jgi:hypothetical protein
LGPASAGLFLIPANFSLSLARPAGRLGKQIARRSVAGGPSDGMRFGSELGRQVTVDFESDADFLIMPPLTKTCPKMVLSHKGVAFV